VKSIRVSNKNVNLNTTLLSINKNGFGGTKISTVSPYTIMESSIYKVVDNAFVKELGVPTVTPVAPSKLNLFRKKRYKFIHVML
jgi:hypothetical protein